MKGDNREFFSGEANDFLLSLEDFLLELERVPDDLELVSKVLGELRKTEKPDGDDLSAIVPKVGMLFDKVRSGEVRVIRKLVDLTLQARDSLKLIIEGQNAREAALRSTIAALRDLIVTEASKGASPEDAVVPSPFTPVASHELDGEIMYRICLGPELDLFLTGAHLHSLLDEVGHLGAGRAPIPRLGLLREMKTASP